MAHALRATDPVRVSILGQKLGCLCSLAPLPRPPSHIQVSHSLPAWTSKIWAQSCTQDNLRMQAFASHLSVGSSSFPDSILIPDSRPCWLPAQPQPAPPDTLNPLHQILSLYVDNMVYRIHRFLLSLHLLSRSDVLPPIQMW